MIELNKTLLVGRLTRDPETRYTNSGQPVCSFSIAVNRTWKDRNSGEKREEVAFIDCEAWGPRAEFIQEWFHKGKPIFIEGRLKQDEWEDRETRQKRSKLKVVVDNASFAGGDRQEDGQRDGGEDRSRDRRPESRGQASRGRDDRGTQDDEPADDLPF